MGDLHGAAAEGDTNLVIGLLGQGIDVHARKTDGWTILNQALRKAGKADVTKPAMYYLGGSDVWTALMLAAGNGHKDVVQVLLNGGGRVNDKDAKGYTSLLLAASHGYRDVVELLLTRGANIHDKDNYGYTAVMVAAQEGHKEVVELLLSRGANIHDKQNNGYTAVMVAAQEGHKNVVELLLTRGANIHAKDKFGYTAVMRAASKGHKEVVELLREWKPAAIPAQGGQQALYQVSQTAQVEVGPSI
jgi:serine/threonine-protein phosphatase 6 regulatory ankyrin repeat subunit B